MIGFLRRNRQPFIISIVIIFFIGIFVGLGGYFFTGADTTESVAIVEGAKIPYLRFSARVEQYVDALNNQKPEEPVTAQVRAQIKQEMLRDMIVNELLAQEAGRMGLYVSDTELATAIRQTPGFQRDGRFDQNLYFQSIRFRYKSSPEQFERHQRRDMLSARLKALMFRNAKVVPGELREEYLRAGAGPLKDYETMKAQFLQQLRQQRALDTINFYLKQRAANANIRTFLDQRERGY